MEDVGGGGGGAGGAGAGAGAAAESPDGFREVGRGGGFFPIGGGGGFLVVGGLDEEPDGGAGGLPGMVGAADAGGLGADAMGGLGAEELLDGSPGSERYEEPEFAPVSTPPLLFLSFGMPPANNPPSWGAESMPEAVVWLDPWSLLLLALFPGTGGASPPGGLGAPPIPGTGGAPPTGGPDDEDVLPTWGADRSLVTAFLKALPLWISERRAPWGMSA